MPPSRGLSIAFTRIVRNGRADHNLTSHRCWLGGSLTPYPKIPTTAHCVSADIATNIEPRVLLPRKDPIEAGCLPEHALKIFPAIFKETWPREPTVEVQASADLSKLINEKIFNPRVHLAFNPANHLIEKMVHEIRARLGLFYGKATPPGKVWGTKSQSQKPKPPSGRRTLPELVDKTPHAICVTQPTVAACSMLSPPECTTRCAWTKFTAHPGADAFVWLKPPVGIHHTQIAAKSLDPR